MVFRQLFDSESSSYTYLPGDEQTKAAVVIEPVKERVEELRKQTRAKIAVHHRVSKCADLPLHDGDHLSVGNIQIEIIETPGHTPDSLSYLVNGRVVFTGDALLMNNLNLPPPKRIDVTVPANLRCGLE